MTAVDYAATAPFDGVVEELSGARAVVCFSGPPSCPADAVCEGAAYAEGEVCVIQSAVTLRAGRVVIPCGIDDGGGYRRVASRVRLQL